MTSRAYTPTNHTLSGLYKGPAKPDRLAIFLHGYGANGADLMGIGEALAEHLPTTGFIAPDAPGELPGMASARQWFPLTNLSPAELDVGVQGVRPLVSDYISAALHDFDLGYDRLVLMGFSQGCMMALEVAPRLPEAVGHVVGFSGALAGPERLESEVVSRPPIFLGHGDADQVVPFAAMGLAASTLEGTGFTVETAAYRGLGHGIDQQGMRTLFEMLKGL